MGDHAGSTAALMGATAAAAAAALARRRSVAASVARAVPWGGGARGHAALAPHIGRRSLHSAGTFTGAAARRPALPFTPPPTLRSSAATVSGDATCCFDGWAADSPAGDARRPHSRVSLRSRARGSRPQRVLQRAVGARRTSSVANAARRAHSTGGEGRDGQGAGADRAPLRVGGVIGIRPEKVEEYKALHAATWPAVLRRIHASNIRNFTIYHCRQLDVLFSHYEYVGSDYDADMAAIAADPETREWWAVCEPCQRPLQWSGAPPSAGGSGEREGDAWWSGLDEVFHCDAHAASFAPPRE